MTTEQNENIAAEGRSYLEGVVMREDGCKCQGCGNRYTVDLLVPDSVWEQIRPSESTGIGGLLCGACIMQRIEAASGFAAWKIVPA